MKAAASLLLALALAASGCGRGGDASTPATADPGGGSALPDMNISVAQAGFLYNQSIEVVHSVTGWLLGLDQVSIEAEDVRDDESSPTGFFADIRITILHNETTLSVVAQDVAVDANGIPTDEEDVRLADAIERLKQKAERYQ
ncbi:hypothetical protein Mal4_54750 [Maioricimonas rarisocia]|uniref:DUF3568 family protein n=1 Tax=Maioricimonas rarisocia TaxID=2528026 RepID=A0A517ZF41_9PLAN|nr:hypothetical protein [Maioricimonas rarisocia]QDU41110.1 hypothetical protein Mal4_54750 [Maioricimonas rarisocia]